MNHKYSFLKIILIVFTVVFSWIGTSSIGKTLACFNDTENSTNNVYSAGFLDFSLSTPTDNFVNLTPKEENYLAKREVQIVQNGSLGFWYKVKTQNISGECNGLNLNLFLENGAQFSQSISSFETSFFIEFGSQTDDLVFKISSQGSISSNKTCNFDLVFEAWQGPVSNSGFSDIETLSNSVEIVPASPSAGAGDIVINEFLPNPLGDDWT